MSSRFRKHSFSRKEWERKAGEGISLSNLMEDHRTEWRRGQIQTWRHFWSLSTCPLLLSGSLFACAIHLFALAKLHRLCGLLEGNGSCINYIHECRVIIVMHFEHTRIHILWYVALYSTFLKMYYEQSPVYVCIFIGTATATCRYLALSRKKRGRKRMTL